MVLYKFMANLENDAHILDEITFFFKFYKVYQVQIRTYREFKSGYIQFYYQYWRCQNKISNIFRSLIQLHITHPAI